MDRTFPRYASSGGPLPNSQFMGYKDSPPQEEALFLILPGLPHIVCRSGS